MTKRVTEAEVRLAALQLLAKAPGGFMTTSSLIRELEKFFRPEGKDAEILAKRSDTHFSQKVRNTISHRNSSTSLESLGYAIYDKARKGWQITDAGRAFVESKSKRLL